MTDFSKTNKLLVEQSVTSGIILVDYLFIFEMLWCQRSRCAGKNLMKCFPMASYAELFPISAQRPCAYTTEYQEQLMQLYRGVTTASLTCPVWDRWDFRLQYSCHEISVVIDIYISIPCILIPFIYIHCILLPLILQLHFVVFNISVTLCSISHISCILLHLMQLLHSFVLKFITAFYCN